MEPTDSDYLAASIRMWLSTEVTPSTARAIETALSIALLLSAVPLKVTMPRPHAAEGAIYVRQRADCIDPLVIE